MCGDASGRKSGATEPVRQLLEIRFRIDVPFPGRALQIPCGSDGRVELDALDDVCRQDYPLRAHSREAGARQ